MSFDDDCRDRELGCLPGERRVFVARVFDAGIIEDKDGFRLSVGFFTAAPDAPRYPGVAPGCLALPLSIGLPPRARDTDVLRALMDGSDSEEAGSDPFRVLLSFSVIFARRYYISVARCTRCGSPLAPLVLGMVPEQDADSSIVGTA